MKKAILILTFIVFSLGACSKEKQQPSREENKSRNDTSYVDDKTSTKLDNF